MSTFSVKATARRSGYVCGGFDGTLSLQAAPGERPRVIINAYNGGVIRPMGPFYGRPVVIDLEGLRAASQEISLLLDHDDRQIVGQSRVVRISTGLGGGVHIEGIVTGNIDDATDPAGKVVMHARNGYTWKASVGVLPERVEEITPGAVATVNGRTFTGPLYVVRAGLLQEVSLLSVGADPTAAAKVAARGTDTVRDVVRDAETARLEGVWRVFGRYYAQHDERLISRLHSRAIWEGWSPTEFETQILRELLADPALA